MGRRNNMQATNESPTEDIGSVQYAFQWMPVRKDVHQGLNSSSHTPTLSISLSMKSKYHFI